MTWIFLAATLLQLPLLAQAETIDRVSMIGLIVLMPVMEWSRYLVGSTWADAVAYLAFAAANLALAWAVVPRPGCRLAAWQTVVIVAYSLSAIPVFRLSSIFI